MDTEPAASGRHYRGASPGERRAERRGRLIAAAIRIYGEVGYRRATVKAVCDAAGLTERYFYESFPNSAALLIAAYDRVNAHLVREIGRASATVSPRDGEGRLRAGFARYFEILRAEPKSARVFLLEMSGIDPSVDEARETALATFGMLIGRAFGEAPDDATGIRELVVAGVVGGVSRIALRWVDSGYALPIEAVTEASCRLCDPLKTGDGVRRLHPRAAPTAPSARGFR